MINNELSSFEISILEKAKSKNKTIVLPEAGRDERVRLAGLMAMEHGINIVMLVDDDNLLKSHGIEENERLKVVNYMTSELIPVLSSALYLKRKDKGLTKEQASSLIARPEYFGTMMVELGLCDGMVCGAVTSTADSLRPALQIIKGKEKGSVISSFMIMCTPEFGENGIMLFSDISLNVNPSASDIVTIAKDTVQSARFLGIKNPKVALLSYSTLGSADGEVALKMREATQILHQDNVDFVVDGEYQLDSAVVPDVAKLKAPNGKIQGDANILIFPNLEAGNISYKAIARFAHIKAIGPICQGFNKPINDVSRGANKDEILMIIAITAVLN